jgi:DnaK suppressor protein
MGRKVKPSEARRTIYALFEVDQVLLMTRVRPSSRLKARTWEGKMTKLSTAELHALEAGLRTRAGELAHVLRVQQQAVAPDDVAQPYNGSQMDGAAPWTDEFVAPTQQARELQEIRRALQRIAQGNYGRCQRCGGEIPHSRLGAQPASELCLACQVESEQHYSLARK